MVPEAGPKLSAMQLCRESHGAALLKVQCSPRAGLGFGGLSPRGHTANVCGVFARPMQETFLQVQRPFESFLV